MKQLNTSRLLLKGVNPSVIHALFNQKTKEEILSFFGCGEDGWEHYKLMHEKGMETHRISLYFFVLVNKETQMAMGECGFHTWNATHNRAELFYHLRKEEFKQQGYMTEALEAILEFGYTELKLHRIEALVANWNTPSLKLLQRYGFTREGTMREDYCVNGKNEDSDCYSLLKQEWMAMHSPA